MKTPTFEEWLFKYFYDPRKEIIYKARLSDKEISLKQLKIDYKRAYKNTIK